MQVYTIPSISTPLYTFLTVDAFNSIPPKYISQSLSFFLQDLKDKIHIHEKEWDNYKKYTNIYEYIHTNNPYKKRSVSKYKPLSRSYFKMVELIHEFRLVPLSFEDKSSPPDNSFALSTNSKQPSDNRWHTDTSRRNLDNLFSKVNNTLSFEDKSSPDNPDKREDNELRSTADNNQPTYPVKKPITRSPICSFHLAEGPGGFIEAVVNLRKNPNDTYIGMTIHDHKNDGTIPTWKKSDHFLISNPNVKIENGADGTGDILSIANFEYCYNTYRSSMDFITADGGFDFSTDFNNQELQIVELLFAQIAFALVMQKPGGNFVLKIFDCFYHCTIDLLALLSSFYKTVYITKPQTSRSGNSEKYVVCKYFSREHTVEDFYPYLYKAFSKNPSTKHKLCVTPPITFEDKSSSVIPRTPTFTPCLGVLTETPYIYRYLTISIPIYFQIKIEEYNSGFGFYQIENIHNTITMIERNTKPDHIDSLIQKNIGKCIEWCLRYNIPHNTFLLHNTFI